MIPAIIAGERRWPSQPVSALPHIRSGRMKAIATTAPGRLAELPNVPTMAEQGFPGIGTNAWQGMSRPLRLRTDRRQDLPVGRGGPV